MRVVLRAVIAAIFVGAMGACSGENASAPPPGWRHTGARIGSLAAWSDPADPRERYAVRQKPSGGLALKDFASEVAINVLLQNRGAQLQTSMPLPACPGEAGLQVYRIPGRPPSLLEAGFTVWNGLAISAFYERPWGAAQDPGAAEAMKHVLCAIL